MLDRLDRLAGALVCATFGLLIFGASVRVHGAGLSCPDWPLCFGRVIPVLDFQVSLEFGHRVWAGAVSAGFVGLTGLVVARRERWGDAALAWAGLAAVALASQIVLGGLTVLQLLAEWTVTSHLLAGNAFCMLLLLLTLTLHERVAPKARAPVSPALRLVMLATAAVVPVQLALGGLVASSYAGLACGTWPTCDGVQWFPTFEGPLGLQVLHRLVAYVLLGLTVLGAAVGRGRGRAGRAQLVVLAAVLAQAALGVANVLLRLQIEVTLLHSAGAAAVVLSTTWSIWEALLSPVMVGRASAVPAMEVT